MGSKTVHVVPDGDQWAVEEDGKRMSTHATQQEAEHAAREDAIIAHGELIVHGRDGRIERKNSYGHDPRNVAG